MLSAADHVWGRETASFLSEALLDVRIRTPVTNRPDGWCVSSRPSEQSDEEDSMVFRRNAPPEAEPGQNWDRTRAEGSL